MSYNRGGKFDLIVTVFIVALLSCLLWIGFRTVAYYISFERDCEGYLKRAADANTVEMAAKQLKIAVDYMEKNDLTHGYTSVLYNTPDEDVGFWYNNVKSSLEELKSLPQNAAPLEKSNMLIKLRETLLDAGDSGRTKVTAPDGISVYPHNLAVFLWGALSLFLAIVAGVVVFKD